MRALMRGAGDVRKFLSDHLEAKMPTLVTTARAQWGISDWQLPMPVKYDSYDPLLVNNYPSIGSVVSRTTNWNTIDITSTGEAVYNANYSVRLFVWARTAELPDHSWEEPSYDSALRIRDDMLALMRSCILQYPSLGSNGVCRVTERSLSEDYLDAIKSNEQSPRWMAGGLISFDTVMEEKNYLPALGQAGTTTVQEGLVP